MNKKELVDEISKSTNLSQAEAGRALVAFEQAVSKALIQGGDIKLVGFGGFSVVKRGARKCRNPQSGKTIMVSARNAMDIYESATKVSHTESHTATKKHLRGNP